MRHWPSLFSRDGWILAEYSFAYEREKNKQTNKQTRERGQYLDILTEQA